MTDSILRSYQYYTQTTTVPYPVVTGGNDAFTILLLHCDGADASTSFPDSSTNAYTVNRVANAQVDTAQAKFGSGSALFDGAVGHLQVNPTSDPNWAFGTGDFVIDFQLRLPSASGVVFVFDMRQDTSSPWPVLYFVSDVLIFFDDADRITASSALSYNTWYHVALVRSSGTTKLFIDGVQTGSSYVAGTNYVGTDVITAGARFNGANVFNGWLDEIRVSKGTDRGWASGFTPPTGAYF